MKRKEKPVNNYTHELSDKEYDAQKKREREQAKKIKYSRWFNKGRY